MGHIYTDTAPLPGFGDAGAAGKVTEMPASPAAAEPLDRIERVLERRIEALREIRRAASLSPGSDEDFATWTRARDRIAKLTRALQEWLSRPF